MFADPFAVAASSPNPAYSWGVIKFTPGGSVRRDPGTGIVLTFNHADTKDGMRHYMRVDLTKDVTNPYTNGVSKKTATVSLAVTVPSIGFTETDMVNLVKTLTDTLADSDVTVTGLLRQNS